MPIWTFQTCTEPTSGGLSCWCVSQTFLFKKAWAKFADFRRTTWEGAQLIQANFWGSNLEGSDIDQFSQSPLELAGVNFQEATWVNGKRCLRGSVGRIVIADVLSVPK